MFCFVLPDSLHHGQGAQKREQKIPGKQTRQVLTLECLRRRRACLPEATPPPLARPLVPPATAPALAGLGCDATERGAVRGRRGRAGLTMPKRSCPFGEAAPLQLKTRVGLRELSRGVRGEEYRREVFGEEGGMRESD